MSQSTHDLLMRGIAAAKANQTGEAQFYLEWALRTDADREQKAEAWLWLSEISDDPSKKRDCLEEVLANEPANALARRELAILDGRLDPSDIIDPDHLPAADPETNEAPVKSQRFVCQRCGGKMAFKPDGRSLRCEYCDFEQTLLAAMNSGAMVQEHDFIVALATAKGHTSPVGMRPFTCQGCGASFLLGSSALSVSCVYCGSAHVVELSETRQLIPPEGLIPFGISEQQARHAFHKWLRSTKMAKTAQVSRVRGLYLPTWTFDIVGEIRWRGYVYRDESPSIELGGLEVSFSNSRSSRRLVREEGNHLLHEDDILVPAGHKLPAEMAREEVRRYDLGQLVPYDEGFLADWPAEVYEISVSDASLVARGEAVKKARRYVKTRIRASVGHVSNLQMDCSSVIVESYKLILLPIWFARYRYEDQVFQVLVNGQTGEVRAQEPRNWLQKLIKDVFS
jgi:DNA-directed RNA polymerase subunit RPC12/RpoP